MSYDHVVNILRELRANLSAASESNSENKGAAVFQMLAAFLGKHFNASSVVVYDLEDQSEYTYLKPKIIHPPGTKPVSKTQKLELPLFISDIEKSRAGEALISELAKRSYNSFAATVIYSSGRPRLGVEIAHKGTYFKWRKEDMFLLEQICSLVDVALAGSALPVPSASTELAAEAPAQTSMESSYQRLARYGNLLFIKISTSFQIIEILGDTKKILGMESKELLKNVSIWERFIEPEDLKRFRRDFARMRFMQQEFREEIKIKAQGESGGRLIFVQVIPICDEKGKTLFWEGFALDITDKRNAELELRNQSKRIEALYEVAKSTQVYHDPALVMLKGLRAVIKATGSDCGLGCFYDPETSKIELAALEGLSQQFLDEIEARLYQSTLIKRSINNKESLLFKNIQEEPAALIDLMRREGLRSALFMPLVLDEVVRGVLVLYCKKEGRYTQNDADLVGAAATQIAVASRQAEYFIAEKQQSQQMTTLYKISHELSKFLTAKEIAQHSLSIIQKQFSCKRIWIGILNEQSTHLVGTAGFGPGIRRRLTEMQIELYLRHDFLDQALSSGKAVIVKAGQEMECSGLNNIIRRLNVGTFAIIPLIALNQNIGAIIIEPSLSSESFLEKNLSLLTTISHEIAATLLGRKFESKINEGEKMRMAGLLASGVAHNFNNLLQAVMGQASLLEMQLPQDSTLRKSARMIVEAAGKGAGLVNQLLNFSSHDNQVRREADIKEVFEDSTELYKSILGTGVVLEIKSSDDLPKLELDYAQFQQVMSNLLINAKDAVDSKIDAKVRIKATHTKLLSGEVDPDLAPGEYIRIDIEDNGVGMDEERQRRCFEPFYSSKNLDSKSAFGFPGSGLGLSYAYSIMKQHNGIITVRSRLEQGSVFSLYFPVPKPQNALKTLENKTPAHQIRYVYLCELEPSIYQTIKPIFESLALKCQTLSSSGKLEQQLGGVRDNVSAIVIDVDKESFHTIPFLQSVHKQFPETFMVVLTQDIRRWSNILSAYKNLYVVSKPLNVWGIHALARKIISHNKNQSLSSQIDLIEGSKENGSSNGTLPEAVKNAETQSREEKL